MTVFNLDTAVIQQLGSSRVFAKDETVFRENAAGDTMYIVLKGTFGVYINSYAGFPVRVTGVEPGSYFGEMAVIDGSPRSASVIAEEEQSVALVIDKNAFDTLLLQTPELAVDILNTLRQRVRETMHTAKQIQESSSAMAAKKMPQIPDYMLEPSETAGPYGGIEIMRELADWLRKLNAFLVGEAQPDTPEEEITGAADAAALTDATAGDIITLLPPDYASLPTPSHPRYKYALRNQELVCPYCGQDTAAAVPVFSALQPRGEDVDGRITYRNIDILLYTNVVCERCAYTDTYSEFSKPRLAEYPRFKGGRFETAEGFAGYEQSLAHTTDEAVMSYYLTIACLSRSGASPLRLAKAWMRLVWLYRDNECEQLAAAAAKSAFDCYTRYLDNAQGKILPKECLRLYGVLADLALSLGDKDTAKMYYKSIADSDPGLDPEYFALCKEVFSAVF